MKKALSLLLFVFIAVGMSLPAFAGELKMMNNFEVKMFNGDRGSLYEGTQNHFSQIFGSKGSYSSEPGFSINWWVEAAAGTWGYDAVDEDGELNFKTIYGKWDTERFGITAGYIDPFFGNGMNYQVDETGGFMIDLKPSKATTITLLGVLSDENSDYDEYTYTDDDGTETVIYTDDSYSEDGEIQSDEGDYDDDWYYGVQVAQKLEGGEAKLYALITDGAAGDSLSTVGLAGNYNLNDIKLTGETATFFGDNGAGTDYTGFFLKLGATVPVSDTFQIEANAYYAPGNDNDDEGTYNFIKRGMVQPFQQGMGPLLDHDDSNLQLMDKGPGNIYELTDDCGVYALGLSGQYKANEKTTLNAGIVFAMPEDEDQAATTFTGPGTTYIGWESLAKLNASVVYNVSKTLMTGVGVSYLTFSDNGADIDDMYGSTVFMSWTF
jgi:hypothetical protein